MEAKASQQQVGHCSDGPLAPLLGVQPIWFPVKVAEQLATAGRCVLLVAYRVPPRTEAFEAEGFAVDDQGPVPAAPARLPGQVPGSMARGQQWLRFPE